MTFLYPSYLWALLGLAVPLAIHLWSKKEGRTIKIGSIQLLQQSDSKQTSNIKLNELLLLLLRLLFITVLAFILAEPVLTKEENNSPIAYFVEPSLLKDQAIRSFMDSIQINSPVNLFTEDFLEYDKDEIPGNTSVPNYWQLSRELENFPADSLVIFTNAFQKGFKGKIPKTGKNINWILLDPENLDKTFIGATMIEDEVELVSIAVAGQNLHIIKENLAQNSDKISFNEQRDSILLTSEGKNKTLVLRTADSVRIGIFYADDFSDEMKYIKSSFSAIGKYLNRPFEIETFQNKDSLRNFKPSVIAWLNKEPAIQTEASLLVYQEDSLAKDLVQQTYLENTYFLTGRLNSENILNSNLTEMLITLLNLNSDIRKEIQNNDDRILEKEAIIPIKAGIVSEGKFSAKTSATKYLWILLLLLLVIERALARYRKQ